MYDIIRVQYDGNITCHHVFTYIHIYLIPEQKSIIYQFTNICVYYMKTRKENERERERERYRRSVKLRDYIFNIFLKIKTNISSDKIRT